ncbi:sensor domain-containing diguanylate cyclase [Marispirochaeta aestuarii]|uniref:sensor domain-containing diguanylate cyclase n=1 Tax=Marispirochaeta aestuarii TaxID=1963862 RepID=UPI0029C712D4|nr:sensor domain-containing diguanylate cyclase [Marispirochaeta aestuarii]
MKRQNRHVFTRSERLKATLLRGVFVFLLINLIATPVFWVFHRMTRETVSRSIREEEMLEIAYTAEQIVSSYQSFWADALYLSSSRTLIAWLQDQAEYETAAADLLNFARSRRVYDNVRFLDMQGNERIRINEYNGYFFVESKNALQNKAHRYYYQESAKLKQGEIYLSRLDLNVENGEIEIPYRPMVRIGTPVFDDAGNKRGVLVLNMPGNQILDYVDTLSAVPSRQVMLVNGHGYCLKGPDPEKEWGFMFAEKNRTGFAWTYPKAWQRIFFEHQGQFFLDKGLYTFAGIDPRLSYVPVLDRTSVPPESIHKPGGSYPLKLISFYPAGEYRELLWERAKGLLLGYFASLLVTFIFSLIIARFLVIQLESRKMIEHLALHDSLTGLPTRRLFYDRLETALKLVRRNRQHLAVLFLDLDNFKKLNDSAGHEAGDILLVETARRIQQNLRESDSVARLGGDEFVVLLENVDTREDLRLVAQKILSAVREPCEIKGRRVAVSVSIGAAMAPDQAETVDDIIRIADEEMYKAKRAGKNQLKTL